MFLTALLSSQGCGNTSGNLTLDSVNSNLRISTQIGIDQLDNPENLSFTKINQNNERSSLPDLIWNHETGVLIFSASYDDFTDVRDRYYAEELLAMGGIEDISFSEIDTNQDLLKQPLGVLRLDVRPKDIATGLASAPYTQFSVVLTRQSFYSNLEKFAIFGEIKPVKAGINRIKVVNEDEKPVANAMVLNYLHGTFEGEDRPVWASPGYRPVIERTLEDGTADIMPLIDEGVYQTIVRAEGYCDYVAPQKKQDPKNNLRQTVILKSCESGQTDFDFIASWDKNLSIFNEKQPQSEDLGPVVYTNEEELKIRLDNRGSKFRPVRIRLSELPASSNEECIIEGYPEIKSFFSSEITIKLPQLFYQDFCKSESKSQQGVGIVDIDLVESKANPDKVLISRRLYVKKSTIIPDTIDASTLLVTSAAGVNGIVSGIAGTQFSIDRPVTCFDERSNFGVQLEGKENIIFKACDKDKITFTSDDFNLPDVFKENGELKFNYFIKNVYSNVSENDPDKINQSETIEVRAIPPDTKILQGQLGITIVFYNKVNTSTPVTEIYEDSISEFLIGFDSSASCEIGNDIYEFAIHQSPTIVTETTNLTRCKSGSMDPGMQSLDINSISFPENNTEDASFFMLVRDSAGNKTEPFEILIPSCLSDEIIAEDTCWRPTSTAP